MMERHDELSRRIMSHRLLTPQEEKALLRKAKHGDKKARDTLIVLNLRLVARIASRYLSRIKHLQFDDLFQVGIEGLIYAIDRFKASKKARLSTYAMYWIKQRISNAISDQECEVRLPVHMAERVGRYRRAVITLSHSLYRAPSVEEIAQELRVSIKEVEKTRKAFLMISSLDAPVCGEGSDFDPLIAFIADDGEDSSSHMMDKKTGRERCLRIMEESLLNDREREVLIKRFGFEDGAWTLEKIGKKFGCTREYIRLVEARALKKLRHPKYLRLFRSANGTD